MFKWEAIVRDYELDSFGIVNHANYVNYFEQSRNDYARTMGIDLFECLQAGYILVIAGIEIKYLYPLKMQDEFYIQVCVASHTKKRIYFKQEIRFKSNDKLIAKALVHVACVEQSTGKSFIPNLLFDKLPPDKYSD